MDLGLSFVSAVLAEGKAGFRKVSEKGVRTDYLHGPGRDAFEYVIEHLTSYGVLPTPEIVTGKTGIELPAPNNSADFFIDTVMDLRLHERLQQFNDQFSQLLINRKPQDAFKLLEKQVLDIRLEKLGSAPAVSMFALGEQTLQNYEDMKAGKRGIPFPWPAVTEASLGMWPGDLILFAARLGIGKTWSLIQVAKAAWESGARVLVATTEMTKERMAQRFHALNLKLPYNEFRRGQLPPFIEQKMYNALKKMMDEDDGRLQIIGGDFDFRIENLASTIDEMQPDAVVLDGAYLIQSEGQNRTEQAANAFNNLKRLANRSHIPFCVSSQFNRSVKKESPNSVQSENIGLTDVAGWNADVIVGLFQTEDMFRDKRMGLKFLKVREGKGEDTELIWDIDQMHFEELLKAGAVQDVSSGYNSGPTNGDSSTEPIF